MQYNHDVIQIEDPNPKVPSKVRKAHPYAGYLDGGLVKGRHLYQGEQVWEARHRLTDHKAGAIQTRHEQNRNHRLIEGGRGVEGVGEVGLGGFGALVGSGVYGL